MVDGDLEHDSDVGVAVDEMPDGGSHISGAKPSDVQMQWLQRGLDQAGGKLPLFDQIGQKVSEKTVRSCIKNGWAEPWFNNPIKPDWLICRLTDTGRTVANSVPLIPEKNL